MKGFTYNSLYAFLASLRGGAFSRKNYVKVPYCKMNLLVLEKFYEKGLILNYVLDISLSSIFVYLKFDYVGRAYARSIVVFSKPSRRVFLKKSEIMKLDRNYYYLFFTENGLFFDYELRELTRGGELLCKFLR